MSVIVSNDIVVVSSGVVSSGLTADTKGEIDVLGGGTLTDSLATNGGWIVVDNGGTVQKVSATAGGDVFVNGNASELTAEDEGMFDIDSGGTLDTGLVKSGGMGAVAGLLQIGVFLRQSCACKDAILLHRAGAYLPSGRQDIHRYIK